LGSLQHRVAVTMDSPTVVTVAPERLGAPPGEGESNDIEDHVVSSESQVSSRSTGDSARRQELLAQGLTPAQIDAVFVRQHRQEVMAEVCRHWLLIFGITSFILGMLTIVMLVWLVFVWIKAYLRGFSDCDTMLSIWGYVLYTAMLLNFAKSTTCGHRFMHGICCWDPDPNFPSRTPLRLKIFNLLLPLFMFSWNIVGIHWARYSTAPSVPALVCQEEGQGVIDAILAFAIVNIALTVFMFINIIGLAYFFRMLLRMGLVQSSKAAPAGSLEASTEKVAASDAVAADCGQCPICLEDFTEDDSGEVLRTLKCQHYFHTACLKDWLQVNRDCPLCRQDLAKPGDEEETPVPPV